MKPVGLRYSKHRPSCRTVDAADVQPADEYRQDKKRSDEIRKSGTFHKWATFSLSNGHDPKKKRDNFYAPLKRRNILGSALRAWAAEVSVSSHFWYRLLVSVSGESSERIYDKKKSALLKIPVLMNLYTSDTTIAVHIASITSLNYWEHIQRQRGLLPKTPAYLCFIGQFESCWMAEMDPPDFFDTEAATNRESGK